MTTHQVNTPLPGTPPISAADPQVRADLIRMLFRQSPSLHAGHYAYIVLVVALLWRFVPQTALLTWAGFAAIVNTLRIALALHFARRPADDATCLRRARAFTGVSALAGAVWGVAGIVFFVPEAPLTLVVLMLALLAHVGTSVAALALFPAAYFALALPSVLPFGLRALAQGDPHSVGMGLFVLLLSGTGVLHCRHTHRSADASVRLRFDNAALVERISVAKDRAEAANQAKSRFLASASHDLRQPTHALGLFVAALGALAKRPQLDRAAVEQIAQSLYAATQNIGRLLNDLLDMTSLDAGVIGAKKRPVALQQVLTDVFEEFSAAAKSAGVALKTVPTSLWVETDPALLRRILANLTSNAVRYTQRGRVLIGCRRRGDRVALQVHDTGIGIAQDQLSAIFQEFYQIDGALDRRDLGLGLGLSIAHRSAELLVARIEVRSAQGRGSTFSILLPRAQAASCPTAQFAGEVARSVP